MVVVEITGVVKVTPVSRLVPPIGTEYQLMIPSIEEAPKVTIHESHLLAEATESMMGAEQLIIFIL